MHVGTLEILATVLIVIAVIKLMILVVNPHAWFRGIDTLSSHPGATARVCVVLAAIVLYALVTAGITITQILAVTVFVVLLVMIGLAPHIKDLIASAKHDFQLSRYLLYTTVWVVLLAWGIKEIFFA